MQHKVTGKYFYRNQDGTIAYWKERIEPGRNGSKKEFRFYHRDAFGDRIWGRGSNPICYNLPQVISSKSIIFTEGEKQADILTKWGLCGTTFDSGSNSRFPVDMIECFINKRIAVLRDNDEPGLVYAQMIGKALYGVAEFVKIVLLPRLPPKGDICDWDGDKKELLDLIQCTAPHIPPVAQIREARKKRETIKQGDDTVTEEMIEIARSYPVTELLEFKDKKAKCIWHEEKTPSLHYFDDNHVKCFGCGAYEGPIGVLMQRDGMDFLAAVKYLAG